ncbi:phosphoribosylamine--glycine ligase [Pelagibacteraceae bacterium]|nr:phosphoribosylamine--glycine ligase [Pelagibacteraceae bacterium]
MNVCVIGSGGREHAICFKLKQSIKLNNLFCMPGNAGTAMVCQNLDVDILNFDEIYKTLKKYSIELVVVGPEIPLVAGIVDYLENKGIKVFGPSMKASQLEGSKIFMKNFCKKFNIPTAKYFEVKSLTEAKKILSEFNAPIVVKSDGLAAGKGVTICNSIDEALDDIGEIMSGKFQSSNKVIIEEFLKGEEASYFVITDGKNFQQVGTAQDHKRVGENDTGLNTGGMGAYSPSLIINKKIEEKILDKIIQPTINGMKELGHPYTGILYAGLMIHEDEPKLIEYNIRYGDPECQALMMRLKTDLLDLINFTINQKLNEIKINWSENPSITVVAASQGYPGKFKKDIEINNLPKNTESLNEQIFHAGTYKKNGKILSNGGRVLNSTVSLEDLKSSRDRALELLDELDWENKYYRRDIGWRAI